MTWIKEIIKAIIAAWVINSITTNLSEFNSIILLGSTSMFIFLLGKLLNRMIINREGIVINILESVGDILVNISIPILVIGSILMKPTQQSEVIESQRGEQTEQKIIEQTF